MIKYFLLLACIKLIRISAFELQNNTSCDVNLTNFKNELVFPKEDCKASKPCIIKCCGENEVLTKKYTCTNVGKLNLTGSNISLDYSDLEVFDSNIVQSIKLTKKKFSDFNIVQSKSFLKTPNCTVKWAKIFKARLLENGNFAGMIPNRGDAWKIKKTLTYCVDLELSKLKNDNTKYKSTYTYYFIPDVKQKVQTTKIYFTGVAMFISAFFMILVLVVYGVLPQLQNLSGMLFMVYLATLSVSYFIKATNKTITNIHMNTCKIISPIMYFLYISGFIWLNVISFDLWSSIREMRLKRNVNRKEIVKFVKYCVFVWGVTSAITLTAVLIDNSKLTNWPNIIKPAFATCMYEDTPNLYYLYIPVGVMTIINMVLFFMTIYNMLVIKKMLEDVKSSGTNQKNRNRFRLYTKMSLLMGISWVLEVFQSYYNSKDMDFWVYVLLNLYNALIGVPIFFMFVFNRPTLRMLTKRFKIKNKFIHDLSMNSSRTRSTVSSRSNNKGSYSRTRTTEQSEIDMTEVSMTDVKCDDKLKETKF